MTRDAFVNLMFMHGDAYTYYNSKISNKQKYYVATLDFTTKYIRDKFIAKYGKEPPTRASIRKGKDRSVLAFCWDLDDFKAIDAETVTAVEPLSDVLRNS